MSDFLAWLALITWGALITFALAAAILFVWEAALALSLWLNTIL